MVRCGGPTWGFLRAAKYLVLRADNFPSQSRACFFHFRGGEKSPPSSNITQVASERRGRTGSDGDPIFPVKHSRTLSRLAASLSRTAGQTDRQAGEALQGNFDPLVLTTHSRHSRKTLFLSMHHGGEGGFRGRSRGRRGGGGMRVDPHAARCRRARSGRY